jgi:Flp pilus assembly pilin Flp
MTGRLRAALAALRNDPKGATAIEYALIALFIGLVLIAGLISIGSSVSGFFTQVANGF